MITVRNVEHREQLLARQELPCPNCRTALRPFGHARTRASNGVNDVGLADRSYPGGPSDATAFTTVVREIPNLSAIRAFGTLPPRQACGSKPNPPK